MAKQRLQKIIAAAGFASRRKAESWIESGRVTVNGRVATIGESADVETDTITVDGRPVGRPEKKVYILLNKPSGYVTSLSDPEGRAVVTELLSDVTERVVPVGRLDLTTEGLLLMTNDGELAQQLAHPSFHVDKTYLVRVRGEVTPTTIKSLEQGVMLEDGPTAPAVVEAGRSSGSHSWLKITIHEGRNRQVRRMCEALGYPVSRLRRIGYAFLTDDKLDVGRYRHLTLREVERLKKLNEKHKPGRGRGKAKC
mgnify:CR=1 FL=1